MRALAPILAPCLAAACAAPEAAPHTAPESPVPAPHAGLVERGRAYLEELRAKHDLPGVSAALVLPDGAVVAFAVGHASREDGTPLTPDALLLSGSIGKTYVAAVALDLAREGALSLDAPLGEYLGAEAWFARLPNAEALTLRHLLRHQSGLARYVFRDEFLRAVIDEPDRVWDPAEQVALVFDLPAAFAPGEGFRYSDTNYLLVGLALEAATGRAFYDLARERVLAPHGLSETVPSDRRDIAGLSQGYDVLFGPAGMPPRVLGADGRFVVNPQFEWCGGGFASTPRDLARWARLYYSGAALRADYRGDLLDTVPAPELGDVRYGPALMLRDTALGELRGHDGTMIGYTSRMGWFPEHDLAVCVQTNVSKPGALGGPGEDVLTELAALALAARSAEAR